MNTSQILNPPLAGAACPKCAKRPLTADMTTMKFPNGFIMGLVFCHDCGHTLNTFPLGFEQINVAAENAAGPRLVS